MTRKDLYEMAIGEYRSKVRLAEGLSELFEEAGYGTDRAFGKAKYLAFIRNGALSEYVVFHESESEWPNLKPYQVKRIVNVLMDSVPAMFYDICRALARGDEGYEPAVVQRFLEGYKEAEWRLEDEE